MSTKVGSGIATGTWRLTRLALRQDRATIPITVSIFVLMTIATAAAITQAYPDAASRTALGLTVGVNPAFLVLLGPLTSSSAAGVVNWRIGLFLTTLLGVVTSITVVRHTRKEEESGRAELVRAGAVGPLAPLLAGLAVGVFIGLAIALPVAGIVGGLGGPFIGSVLVGTQYLGMAAVGAGVAALAAQITTVSRTANAISSAFLMAGYLIRGIGDVREPLTWLRWTTPSGWVGLVDPYGENRVGPVLALFGFAGVLIAVAAIVAVRRDLDGGLIRPRPGPAEAKGLDSVRALLGRLYGTTIVVWSISAGAYALLVGMLVESAGDLVSSSPQIKAALTTLGGTAAMSGLMVAMVTWFVGLAAGAWAITTVAGLVRDEANGRVGQILAAPIGRGRLFGGVLVLLGIGVVVIPVVFGGLLGIGHLVGGGLWPDAITEPLRAGLVQLPAVAVVAGLALALYGWAPRWVPMAWGVIVWGFLGDLLSALSDMPAWLVDLSPYAHIPAVPMEAISAEPLLWLGAVSVGLALIGLLGLRHRDLVG